MDPQVRALAEAGFAVHFLRPKSKAPRLKLWSTAPVLTPEQLDRVHRPDLNYGVRLGEPSQVNGMYLHVIDMDVRVPELAEEAVFELVSLLGGEVLSLPTVQSGSGGPSRHFYFCLPSPMRSRKLLHSEGSHTHFDERLGRDVKSWDWEIELFGSGKQVAMPPSVHPSGGLYSWIVPPDLDALELGLAPTLDPSALEALDLRDSRETGESVKPIGLTLDRAREILEALDVEVWCEDREGWLRAGMALQAEFGDEGRELWDDFSAKSGKFDSDVQDRTWASFEAVAGGVTMRSLAHAAGVSLDDPIDPVKAFENHAPAVDAAEDAAPEDDDPPEDPYEAVQRRAEEALNDTWALVLSSGQAVAVKWEEGALALYNRTALATWYANRTLPTLTPDGKETKKPISELWIASKRRRAYMGLKFDPTSDPSLPSDGPGEHGPFNLWRGWSVEPDPEASCERFLEHLRTVICAGNAEHFNWLIRWLAHMIQKPGEKPGTTVVLKGARGTGKDLVASYVGAMFKHHHVTVSQPKHITGNFNAHMAQCLLLHVEEGFWAGDRQAEQILKHIITSPHILLEKKGVDAVMVRSCFRVMMTSNEEWSVPASEGERRYFILLADGLHARDEAWFAPIVAEMEGDGPAALLAYLQALDLKGFNVRLPIATEALLNEQRQGLRGVAWWWNGLLEEGELPGSAFTDPIAWGEVSGALEIDRETLYADYVARLERTRYKGEVKSRSHFLVELEPFGVTVERRGKGGKDRVCVLPSLVDAKARFKRKLR